MTIPSDPRAGLPSASILRGMDFAEYGKIEALNWSRLKAILRSPLHFKVGLEPEPEQTIDQTIGQMAHLYVLEGKVPKYVIRPEYDPEKPGEKWHGGRNSCKRWLSAQNVPVLSPAESQREIAICNAIADDLMATHYLLNLPEREVVVTATHRGVPLKCRIDAAVLGEEFAVLLDIKKCQDASPSGFGKAVVNYNYLGAMGQYRRIVATALNLPLAAIGWCWLAVEDSLAAPVVIYRPTPEQEIMGNDIFEGALSRFIECEASGKWPGYAVDGQESNLTLPIWFLREYEQMKLKAPAIVEEALKLEVPE